jgi:glycosyltransferase involved in cell wall biosynthesis
MLDPWFNERYPLKHLKKAVFWPWTEYRLLRDARATIFTCEIEKSRSSRSFKPYRCNPEIVVLGIHRPPNDPDRQLAAFYAQFPQLQGKRILLYLSRIHPKKGCDLLVQAFAEIASRHDDIQLVIAGPDQMGLTTQLRQVAAKAGIADRITWPGMITGDVKWGAYRAANAFILPTHHENFGIVVAEAMACGLPVLISDQVQIWQEIAASNAGYVEPDTLDGTRRLIERWLTASPAEWDAMRQGALDGFESKFEVNAFAQRFMEVIERYLPGAPQVC